MEVFDVRRLERRWLGVNPCGWRRKAAATDDGPGSLLPHVYLAWSSVLLRPSDKLVPIIFGWTQCVVRWS